MKDSVTPKQYGDTPLHLATHQEDLSHIKLILQHGGDPLLRNNEDMTPADIAHQKGFALGLQVFESSPSKLTKDLIEESI